MLKFTLSKSNWSGSKLNIYLWFVLFDSELCKPKKYIYEKQQINFFESLKPIKFKPYNVREYETSE